MRLKTTSLFIASLLCLTLFAACSSEESSSAENANSTGNAPEGRGSVQVVGRVEEILGNEISLQVGEMEGGGPGGGQGAGQGAGDTSGAGPDAGGAPEGEGTPEGEGRPEGEGPPEGEGRPEGGGPPEGAASMTEEERTAMQENGGGQGMQGGMATEQDYSELITLSDEIRSFMIPVDAPVQQFGTEMTFSQITEGMYISVSLDDNDTVVSINVLG